MKYCTDWFLCKLEEGLNRLIKLWLITTIFKNTGTFLNLHSANHHIQFHVKMAALKWLLVHFFLPPNLVFLTCKDLNSLHHPKNDQQRSPKARLDENSMTAAIIYYAAQTSNVCNTLSMMSLLQIKGKSKETETMRDWEKLFGKWQGEGADQSRGLMLNRCCSVCRGKLGFCLRRLWQTGAAPRRATPKPKPEHLRDPSEGR